MVLLRPGAELTRIIIARLRRLGVTQLWVDHPLTRDLDAAVAPSLIRARLKVFNRLKADVAKLARRTLSTVQLRAYREAIADLVREVLANKDYVNLTDRLFDAEQELVSHSTNVAFLSVLVGLELEGYLVRERTRLPAWRAKNVVNLGLGGLLHDFGKIALEGDLARRHEVLDPDGDHPPEYFDHPAQGYDLLPIQVPSAARNAVLRHHLRFDGTGWCQRTGTAGRPGRIAQAGHRIHIFSRIVAAANALDNLMRDADGHQRPAVAALHDFASVRFDGWFDPVVRMTVLKRIPPFAVGTQVTLSDGRPAVVTRPSLDQPCRPTVRLLDPSEKLNKGACTHVDLAVHPTLRISAAAGVPVEQFLFETYNAALKSRLRRDHLSDVA